MTLGRKAPHLSHGGGLVFLLGAGASMPAGIPNVLQFVDEFKADLVDRRGQDDLLVRELIRLEEAWEKAADSDSSLPRRMGLERLYELLTLLGGEGGRELTLPVYLPSTFPSPSRACELLAWELKKYVQRRCLGYKRARLRYLRPLLNFIDPEAGLDILSLNYDTCIESLLEKSGRPWGDGFPSDGSPVHRFTAEAFLSKSAPEAVRLLKVHGSASWYEQSGSGVRRVLSGSQPAVGLKLGSARSMTHEAMMIYPTLQKALTDGPFPALILAAQQVFAGARLLVAAGYGFADRHIRSLVLGALASNSELRLVLVDPWPEGAVRRLFADPKAPRDLKGRVGVCGVEPVVQGALKYGFLEEALMSGWLHDASKRWLRGEPLVDPLPSIRSRSNGRTWTWRLRVPLDAGAAHMARGSTDQAPSLWVLGRTSKVLQKVDVQSGALETIKTDLIAPRGLVWDPAASLLYVVENRYRTGKRLPGAAQLGEKAGLGRLWALDQSGKTVRPLTRLNFLRASARLARKSFSGLPLSEILGRGLGVLSWPTSVLLERPGVSVLLTEARALVRLDLASRKLSYPVEIPLCFNLVSLSRGPGGSILMVDGGVYPHGRGRLLVADLDSGRVQVLYESATRLTHVAWHERHEMALVSTGWGWPRGKVLAFRLGGTGASLVGQWEGLDYPGPITVIEEMDLVLVGTAEGLVELSTDRWSAASSPG
ncbi:MAG: SIR2 family protein [Acidobacteriota bacterium]|nr:SIR2 family protein [Acidobacteriota bacterium]